MVSVQHYKLSGDVVLRTINSSDVKNTFIFLDKRTGKCFTFDPTEFKFSETNLQEEVWQNFDSLMLNNINFLKIVSFFKKGKVNTSYEPKIVSTIIENVMIKFYVDDTNLKGAGLWLDLTCANNGQLAISYWESTTNCIDSYVKGKTSPVEISFNGPSGRRRICEIVVDGEIVYSDHLFI